MPSNRTSTRFSASQYLGHRAYFITICCDHRHNYLASHDVARDVISILSEVAAKHLFLLYAYCAMPNHIHLLLHGQNPNCDLLRMLNEFKSRTAYRFKKAQGNTLWERSFYDHILRKPDALESVARYIWNNPVRKGLCKLPQEFPFSGSQTVDWMKSANNDQSFIPPWKSARPV